MFVLNRSAPASHRYVALAGLATATVIMLSACPSSITDAGYVLSVSPATASLFVDDTTQFSAALVDQAGAPVTAPLSWSIDNTSVAQVDATGRVWAVGEGSATLTVSGRGETATASLTVAVDNGQTLTVSPTGANLFVDGTQRFVATLENRNGDTMPATPEWSSDNPGVATVDATGLVRGVGTGTATIRATVRHLGATASVTVGPRPSSVVLVGAGDIASCNYNSDEATAKLLDAIPGTVFTAGDNAYENASAEDFANCYAPTWGRHKERTRPAAGNHEYHTLGATAYFDYFGSAAGDRDKGYYSYDIGSWHIVVLNSNLAMIPGSAEETWLRADLAANPARCTLAIWHHPRFSSGPHGSSLLVQPLYQALYDAGADVVVTAHDHLYERFAPQTPDGQVDLARGLRQFVVGTGGASLYSVALPAPNSEVRNTSTRGVIKFTLFSDRYEWNFVPVKSGGFTDSGSASCH